MHSDPTHGVRLEEFEQLIEPSEPNQPFEEAPPKYKEVVDKVMRARAASAPGLNGVPYKVDKHCQRLTRHLWWLIRVIWRRGRLANSWCKAEGRFIPREENS